MTIIINILFIAIGIVGVLYGADRMTEGAVALAKRMHIPEIVIGLTIVAIGTSAPELFVSVMSAVNSTPDMAVGNVVGSNIFNTLLITGMAATLLPITVSKTTVHRDLPIAFLASAALIIICLDRTISRRDALLLFVAFVLFLVFTVKQSKTHGEEPEPAMQPTEQSVKSAWKAAALIIVGLALLIGGSQIFVSNASQLAAALGVSEAVIGLTIVAGGTSLPELATSIVAAKKGQSDIAIGNVLGSNIFNILLIVGLTGMIQPMSIVGITTIDLAVMFVSMVVLWLFAFTKLKIERWEGLVLLLFFAAYMAWLLH